MNDNTKWRVVRLDDLERRGRFIPVREHLGIHSFGINAIRQGEDGTLINEHDEAGGQEEVYVVLDGTATFEVDGETFEAPAGTFVSVRPEARRKATGDATVLALGGTVGEAVPGNGLGRGLGGPQRVDGRLWRTALRRRGSAQSVAPSSSSRTTRASTTTTRASGRWRARSTTTRSLISGRGVEGFPPFRGQARVDEDLAAVHDDPRFEEALR